MKTKQIIDTLQDWKRIGDRVGEVGITLDSAIEKLQYSEEYKRQVDKLKQERDEAIERVQTLEKELDEMPTPPHDPDQVFAAVFLGGSVIIGVIGLIVALLIHS